MGAFEKYEVLSKRELESRFEVWVEQYVINANIEAETAAMIARTMLLPAALRHLALIDAAEVSELAGEARALVDEFVAAIKELESANVYPDGVEGLDLAIYARDNQLTAMAKVREVADRLEKIVADDLWPLPKYSEILFVEVAESGRTCLAEGERRDPATTRCATTASATLCVHQKLIRNTRGSSFSMCERSKTDPRYPKYPRVPCECRVRESRAPKTEHDRTQGATCAPAHERPRTQQATVCRR